MYALQPARRQRVPRVAQSLDKEAPAPRVISGVEGLKHAATLNSCVPPITTIEWRKALWPKPERMGGAPMSAQRSALAAYVTFLLAALLSLLSVPSAASGTSVPACSYQRP